MAQKKPVSKDDAWLAQLAAENSFYAKQPDVIKALAQTDNKPSVDDTLALEQITAEQQAKQDERTTRVDTRRVSRLHVRAERADAADRERIQREEKQQEDRAAERQARKQELKQGHINASLKNASRDVSNGVANLADRVGSVQTVGGIGLLIVILAILVFAVVQVNAAGDTRLKQFWYMLNGRAQLQGAVHPIGVIGGGAGGSFQSAPTPGAVGGFANPPTDTSTSAAYRTTAF